MQPPTFSDVLAARLRIAPYLARTPLHRYPALDAVTGTRTYVKHENHQPVGAFKVRGGVNLVATLSPAERARGVCAASTGNHGQSVAYAARLFGVPAVVCAPEAANPVKVASMRGLGAEVILTGRAFDDSREFCEKLAVERDLRYVHVGDEPLLIAGVATATLEIFEAEPDLDVLLVPVGAGSGASAAALVASTVAPRAEVIGVQSAESPAAHQSWQAGELRAAPNRTIAEGLATGTAVALPQSIMRERLADFVLVSDEQLLAATKLMIEKTCNLVELAGAAPLAAALADPARFAGRKVGLMCSGGNLNPAVLAQLFG
jgi:threonine dehydratase